MINGTRASTGTTGDRATISALESRGTIGPKMLLARLTTGFCRRTRVAAAGSQLALTEYHTSRNSGLSLITWAICPLPSPTQNTKLPLAIVSAHPAFLCSSQQERIPCREREGDVGQIKACKPNSELASSSPR